MDLNNVSDLAGVYLWKDANDNIIYIGKSKNLKKRMTQYFNGTMNSFKTTKMVEKIRNYETIICNNENEALLLERNLIQRHKPFYNICFMDDRKYPYINIFLNKKGLFIEKKFIVNSENKNNLFYGPYLNNGSFKALLNFLKSECLYEKGLPIQKESFEFWTKKFLYAKKILSKNNKELLLELTNKMHYLSDNEQFERANEIKDVIKFISLNKDIQIVELKNNKNLDVLVGITDKNFLIFCIQFYRNGSLINNQIHAVEIKISKTDTIRQFINQFYKNKQLPSKIITNLDINFNDLFFKSEIIIPKKGKYFSILNLAIKNANENINFKILEYKQKQKIIIDGINFLKKVINIQNLNHIIMVDNSNLKNENAVSVIISFKNGLPQKNEYKKFNIIPNSRKSDVEYIKQGLEKFFDKTTSIPDLLIVDGGIQQLNEAKKILEKLDIQIPVIGLVKNDKHKTNFIILENNIRKTIDSNAYLFLCGMQEEVDRFAKVIYRNKSSKNSLEGRLINISGIGPKTEQKILKHFKTYNNIYNANINELKKIVSENIAETIIKTFKEKSNF